MLQIIDVKFNKMFSTLFSSVTVASHMSELLMSGLVT
jgi:hypothetical protein